MHRLEKRSFVRSFGALMLLCSLMAGAFIATPGPAAAHGDPHPAHIHVGDCSAPGSVVGPLNALEYASEDGGVAWSESTVDLTLDAILAEPHAVVVHESADNMGNYILCGNIGGVLVDGSLTIALGELNGSGHVGVAVLTEGMGTTDVIAISSEGATAAGTIAEDDAAEHPAHIHDGTSGETGGVVFPLTAFSAPEGDWVGGDGVAPEESYTEIETTLADLTASPHVIIAHASSDNMGTYIIAGDITGDPEAGGIAVQLVELNDSGHVGIAWLEEGEAGVGVSAYLVPGAAGGEGSDDEATPDEDMADHEMGGEEVAATIEGFAFSPNPLEIKVGTTVTWTNNDSAPHTVTANDRSFESPRLDQGGTFTFTFTEPGTFEYFCEFHPNMTATVVVTE